MCGYFSAVGNSLVLVPRLRACSLEEECSPAFPAVRRVDDTYMPHKTVVNVPIAM